MSKKYFNEKGQALILIVLAITAIVGIVGLAMDGGQAFSDRRQAQNAVDAAVMAMALQYRQEPATSGNTLKNLALAAALANGYPNDNVRSSVTFSPTDGTGTPANGTCPEGTSGREFSVTLVSNLNTWFAPIVGISQVHNTVLATSRACEYRFQPYFNGNTIVGLAPVDASDPSLYAAGSTTVKLECGNPPVPTGGFFVNGNAESNGAALTLSAPSLLAVGTVENGYTQTDITTVQSNATSAAYEYPGDIVSMMPRTPACNGTAYESGGKWYPEAGKDGSKVYNWNGDDNGKNTSVYAAGVYCVMSVKHPWAGTVTAIEGSTFFIMIPDLTLKIAGNDAWNIIAPSTGEYAGYAIVMPFTCTGGVICDMNQLEANPPTQTVDPCVGNNGTPTIDLRGNGTQGITGAVWMPTACITLYGNPDTTNHGQMVAYRFQTSGNADLKVCYQAPENPQQFIPPTVELWK